MSTPNTIENIEIIYIGYIHGIRYAPSICLLIHVFSTFKLKGLKEKWGKTKETDI